MRHHYVPVCYLRSFVDPACPPEHDPYLWVVDLDKGEIRRKSPENTAVLTDYYAVGDGENRYDVEKYLATVENQTAPVLTRILSDSPAVEGTDRGALSYFAALQIVRVPRFRDRIEKFITEIGQTVNAIDQLYDASALDLDSYRISANPEAALGHGINAAPMIADLLNRISWVIMEPAGADNLWSSDNPLYYINPNSDYPSLGHALGVNGVEVNLPIGPRRCLLMAWSDISGPRVLIEDLRCAQERGIAGAKRYLFCSTEQDAKEAFDAYGRLFPR